MSLVLISCLFSFFEEMRVEAEEEEGEETERGERVVEPNRTEDW